MHCAAWAHSILCLYCTGISTFAPYYRECGPSGFSHEPPPIKPFVKASLSPLLGGFSGLNLRKGAVFDWKPAPEEGGILADFLLLRIMRPSTEHPSAEAAGSLNVLRVLSEVDLKDVRWGVSRQEEARTTQSA